MPARLRVTVQTASGARQLVADLCDQHAATASTAGAVLSSDEGPIVGAVTGVYRLSGRAGDCVVCSGRVEIH